MNEYIQAQALALVSTQTYVLLVTEVYNLSIGSFW